jgi:hypothetical protein
MSRELLLARLRALLLIVSALSCIGAQAQAPQVNATCTGAPALPGILNEVHTIADSTQAVPLECSFDVSVAGTYQVTLSDLGVVIGSDPAVPAPLAAVKLTVTSGSTVAVDMPLESAGSLQFAATPGTYVIRVTGLPGPDPGSGPVGISVTNTADSSILASFSATLALPATSIPSNESVIDDSFSVASDGSYVVTLADLQLPQPLTTLTLLITTSAGTLVTSAPLATAGSVTVPLQHGVTYRIFAAAQADSTVNAGLFSATVVPASGGTPVYSKIVPVGSVALLATTSLTAGATYSLSLSDLAYPAALASLGAVVANNGQAAAPALAGAGTSQTFTASAVDYQVFGLATAAAPATGIGQPAGSYAIALNQTGGPPALSIARAVSPPTATTPTSYNFDGTVTSAGSYSLDLIDFSFPTSFASLSAIAVQNGAIVGQPLAQAGTQTVAAAAGPISVLVFAQPGSAGSTTGSLFGADLKAGTATPVFETTQGVGALFASRQVNITTPGDYAVAVSDVKFPAPLTTFAAVVTQGSTQLGSIFGGGGFTFKAATAGTYFINFIATPGGDDKAGTYALSVAPGPAITSFASDVTSVASGGVANLKWTTINADSCTASGGWTGTQPASGNFTSAALTSNTTFTLTCTGAGATTTQSLTVSVTAPPPANTGGGGKGGGGALSIDLLVLLLGILGRKASRRLGHAFVIRLA